MASSSDWMTALAQQTRDGETETESAPRPKDDPLGWMQSLLTSGEFVEGAPFAALDPAEGQNPADNSDQHTATEPQSDAPMPDPLAEAEARGRAAGHSAAQAEWQAKSEQQRALRIAFQSFDQTAMDSLAAELADTVIHLCSSAIADFQVEPDSLAKRCGEAAARFGSSASECKLHLHPDDIARLDPETAKAWQIVADPGVERSGLRFEGADGSISDSPKDWRRAIAAAIKG